MTGGPIGTASTARARSGRVIAAIEGARLTDARSCQARRVITGVKIEDFRGVREGGVEGLAQISILVGPNNSGWLTEIGEAR